MSSETRKLDHQGRNIISYVTTESHSIIVQMDSETDVSDSVSHGLGKDVKLMS